MEIDKTFSGAREAKEYLVEQILLEAQREGISLSEIERKMLYFSENYWTLPEMPEISKEFDRLYDQEKFEAKIAGLIRRIQQEFLHDEVAELRWDEAVSTFSKEDHYLLVLLKDNKTDTPTRTRSLGSYIKLLLIGFLIAFAISAAILLLSNH
jgi:hypothetical protein